MGKGFAWVICWLLPTSLWAAEPIERALAELTPSSLSVAQQRQELDWFIQAARPFQGMTVRVVSEDIKTHWYEANVLAPLFSELTGIRVIQEITGEDDVVKTRRTQE